MQVLKGTARKNHETTNLKSIVSIDDGEKR